MKDLARQLTDTHAEVFAALGIDPAYSAVTRSNRPDLGEFQSNGALAAAKAAGGQPREIAEESATSPRSMSISTCGWAKAMRRRTSPR
jgi:arginyl-tRNA synthetase